MPARRRPGVPGRLDRHLGRRTSASAAADVVLGRGDLLGGRRVVVQVPLGQPDAADVHRPGRLHAVASPSTNSVDPPPMSATRNGGGGRRRGPARRRGRGRAEEGQLGLLPARRSTSGSAPSVATHHRLEVVPVGGVPGGAGGDHPHRARPPSSQAWRRTRRARPGCARSPRVRAGRCGRRPDRAGPAPCAAAGRSCAPAAGSRRRPAAGSSWCRSRSRRPGSCRAPRPTRTGRPPTTPRLASRTLVAERVDPGPGGERVREQRVQALDPVGMPPALTPAISGTSIASPARPGRPRARPGSAAASSGSVRQPVCHLAHGPAASSRPTAAVARGQVR